MNKIIIKFLIVFSSIFFILFINSCSKQETVKENNEISNPIVAYASVDKVKATIGDIITFQLNVDYTKGIKIKYPEIKKYLGDFIITSEKKEEAKLIDNRLVDTFIYKLQVHDPGSYIIQPIEIKYTVSKESEIKFGKNNSVKTSKIFIEIKSVLKPEDKDKDIEDIKPLEEITVLSKKLIALFIIVIFLVILVIYLLRRKLNKPEKILLPHEEAFKELSSLKELKLLEKEEFKIFYFKLSEILRRYLKNRFEILALEKVSDEVIKDIDNIQEITHDKKIFIKSFLETTDFYKFTDTKSFFSEASELYDKAYNFVSESTKVPETIEEKKD